MGGFCGVISKDDCVSDLFFGTDYHSHLGTHRGGMCVLGEKGFQRSIHNIQNSPFRSKFEHDVANLSDLSYHIDFAQSADAEVSQTCVAVAMDKNGTPTDYVARKVFYLKPIPESPAAVYSIKPYKSAASIFWIQVDFEPTCKNCYYRWMSEQDADAIKAYSEDQKKLYALDLAKNGWGVRNYKFSFDVDNNVPNGDTYTAIENQIVAYAPHQKDVIVSAGENFYGEVTDLQFSEPVVMKPRVTDAPQTCLVSDDEFNFVLDNVSRTGFRYNFNYSNPDEVAIYYFQIVSPVDQQAREENPEMCPPEDIYNASREDWMKFFFVVNQRLYFIFKGRK